MPRVDAEGENIMERLCSSCGKPSPPEHAFCENCGAASSTAAGVEGPATAAAGSASQTAAEGSAPIARRRSKLWIPAALALLLALGIGGWLFLNKRSATQTVAATSSASSTTIVTTSASAASLPPATVATETAAVATETSTASTEAVEKAAVAALGGPEPLTPETVVPTPAENAATGVAERSKPCSLVTRAEMEKILGIKVTHMTSTERICSYFTDGTSSADLETSWTGGKAEYAETKSFGGDPSQLQAIPAIGDEAYLHPSGVLHFR